MSSPAHPVPSARAALKTLPVIDLARLRSDCPAQKQLAAEALGKAARDVGFFYVTGTYLMGITQTWLFAPRPFSLKARAPFFRNQLLKVLGLGPDGSGCAN